MPTLWNPKKPLNQPPGFGRVGCFANPSKPCQAEKAAKDAINSAQFARERATQRVGGRRAVVTGE